MNGHAQRHLMLFQHLSMQAALHPVSVPHLTCSCNTTAVHAPSLPTFRMIQIQPVNPGVAFYPHRNSHLLAESALSFLFLSYHHHTIYKSTIAPQKPVTAHPQPVIAFFSSKW
ncbi:hypothetical protein P280DRAFT_300545 [Massarina eburnea CBS 473.64]|uniref:Uncharacterized protein n=1 Tax=Massarina eburnea CBS 473.64 TaxID=1395130 RepID=A0A6A6S4G0_9PLEO|nr:hypothetical protein P280DRAFT_300545 [Massarina eburnea CBS 473.64]